MLIIVINFSELNNKNVTDELLVWSIPQDAAPFFFWMGS